MPQYICPRCGYSSHIKTYLHKHFLRKKPCVIKNEDLSIETCYLKILGNTYPGSNNILNNNKLNYISVNDVNDNVNANVNDVNANVNANVNDVNANVNDVNANVNDVNANVNANVNDVNAIVNDTNKSRNKLRIDLNLPHNKYKCKYCNKELNTRQGRYAHHKICKLKKNPVNLYLDNKDIKFSDNSKDFIISQQAQQLEIMKTKIELLLNQNSKSNIQNIHGDQNNVNFYINAFGNENIEYITDSIIQRLIVNEPMNSVPKLLQNIHFHPNHSENHNIYIPNKKDSLAKIYDGTKWIYRKKKDAIEDMANKALNIIEENDNTNTITNIKDEYYNGNKIVINRIHDDTEIMILNEGKNISK